MFRSDIEMMIKSFVPQPLENMDTLIDEISKRTLKEGIDIAVTILEQALEDATLRKTLLGVGK